MADNIGIRKDELGVSGGVNQFMGDKIARDCF
jgi:hypothetical protein